MSQMDREASVVQTEAGRNSFDKEKISEKPHMEAYSSDDQVSDKPSFWDKYYKYILAIIWVLMTAFFIASLVLHPELPLVRCLVYAFISFKIMFEFVPTRVISKPIALAWKPVSRLIKATPTKFKFIGGVLTLTALILGVAFGSPETERGTLLQRAQSLLGICVFITLMWLTSRNRSLINWQTVIVGILIQFLLGIFVIKTWVGFTLFQWISERCTDLLGFAKAGSAFLFGEYSKLPIFVMNVLPGVLFFASFIQIIYYTGAMQWVIVKFAWFFKSLMDTSGSESVVAAASPFVGQGESALLVKPFLVDMTISELHQVMASGFATIAGSVLIAFISFGIDPQALITSCVMSIPCSLAMSKMRIPETEESKTKGVVAIPDNDEGEVNILHAAANGAAQGVTLVLLISGTLLAIISLLAFVNAILTWLGGFLNIEKLTLELIMGYFFVPFAFLVGIEPSQCYTVGQVMATKMFVNEFAAFELLAGAFKDKLSERSHVIATFSICGFANLASIGIQVGCLGAMAPSRKSDLASVAFSAMLTGTMSTFVSATIAGMLV